MAVTALIVRVRKNGANGAQSVTVLGAQTGQFEDATNTDAFVASDEFSFLNISGGTAGSVAYTHQGVLCVNTEPQDFDSTVSVG